MESMFFYVIHMIKAICVKHVTFIYSILFKFTCTYVLLAGMNFKSFGSIFTCIMSNILFEKRSPESFIFLLQMVKQ